MKKLTIALTVLLVVAAGCNKKEAAQAASAPAQPAAAAQAQAEPRPSANMLTGKVVETFDGGGYTYVRVAAASGEQWAAIPQAKVAKGDTVSIAAQMTMENFESKTLNRTFDTIVFGSIVTPGAVPAATAPAGMQAQMPPGHGATRQPAPAQMASAMGGPAQHMKTADADVKVEKAEGGKSVAEIWAERSSLNGKPVVVRGKVVKFLGGIMGKNWMHIQDGTGSGEKGDHDITVTTDERAAVGSVVTIKGTVVTDKDFGAGYRYDVIIENGKLQ